MARLEAVLVYRCQQLLKYPEFIRGLTCDRCWAEAAGLKWKFSYGCFNGHDISSRGRVYSAPEIEMKIFSKLAPTVNSNLR